MPLLHSASPSAFDSNVRTLMHEVGKSPHVGSPKQALAIAYSEQRRAAQKRAPGGFVGFGPSNFAMPAAGGVAPPANALPQTPWTFGGQQGAPVSGPGGIVPMPITNMLPAPSPAVPAGIAQPFSAPAGGWASGVLPQSLGGAMPGGAVPSARGGSVPRAMGGIAPTPWQVRAEARNLMHTGPILSAVPGRTDRHAMQVPSGSYVIPAQAVSHLGQSNTLAGMKVLNGMFGSAGPYGAGQMGIKHGAGMPRAPKSMGVLTDRGGARGEGVGSPTDVITAGGEYVIPPHVVAAIGGGDLKQGHKILDAWVMHLKDEHVKTLKKLAPPAKS